MNVPTRVTGPFLAVLAELLQAHEAQRWIHGYEIKKRIRKSGPTVYGVLGRLERAGWVRGQWVESPGPAPQRKMFRLTSVGVEEAQKYLAQ